MNAFCLIVLAALSSRNSSRFCPLVFWKLVTAALLYLMSVEGGMKLKRSSEAGGHLRSIGCLSGYLSNFTGDGMWFNLFLYAYITIPIFALCCLKRSDISFLTLGDTCPGLTFYSLILPSLISRSKLFKRVSTY